MLMQECGGILTAFETNVQPIEAGLKKLLKHISVVGHSDIFQNVNIETFINTDIYQYVIDRMQEAARFIEEKRVESGMSDQCCDDVLKMSAIVMRLRGPAQPTQHSSNRNAHA